jgi:hypothetical protein
MVAMSMPRVEMNRAVHLYRSLGAGADERGGYDRVRSVKATCGDQEV